MKHSSEFHPLTELIFDKERCYKGSTKHLINDAVIEWMSKNFPKNSGCCFKAIKHNHCPVHGELE